MTNALEATGPLAGSALSGSALAGRVAVVTGAAGGLGGAIVRRLSELGAGIVLLELDEATAARAAAEVEAAGGTALGVGCDISEEGAVAAAAQRVAGRFGRCDILVNNAALLPRPLPLEEIPAADWDRALAVNLRGPFLCAKHFGASMLAARSGSIVNVASVAGTFPNASGAYGPSKAGVLALTRQMAVEWGPRGVRANAVSPGLVRTPMSRDFYADPKVHEERSAAVALRRIGEPEDIAAVVAFLAGDEAAYVNGQEIVVDGGFIRTALMRLQPAADQPRA